MTRKSSSSRGGRPPRSSSPRTVIPNGPKILAARKAKGWTREDFEWESHLAVQREALSGGDIRLVRRVKERKRRRRLAGLGKAALSNLEKGKAVYPITLKIAALTLGVSMQSLIDDDADSD